MNITNMQSLQNSPIEASSGYFDPTIAIWGDAIKSIENLKIELNFQNTILSAGSVIAATVVTGVNFFITAPAKLLQVSSANNLLDDIVRYPAEGAEALVRSGKRGNLNALTAFVSAERLKIIKMINEPNNALGSATPNQLVSSKQVIFNGMSQLMDLSDEFWGEFLRDIYEDNKMAIDKGIKEIDNTLKNKSKIKEQVSKYKLHLNTRMETYKNLEAKKNNLINQLNALKNRLNSSKAPSEIQNEINILERKISDVSKKLDNLLSRKDLSGDIRGAVRENLEKRKAFLESLKTQKSVLYVEQSGSWTKTVFKACSVLGIAASGYYVYNNGIPSKDDATKMIRETYNYYYNYIKENATRDNANYIWNSLTTDNITGFFSRESAKVQEKIKALWEKANKENFLKFYDGAKEDLLKRFEVVRSALIMENFSSAVSNASDKVSATFNALLVSIGIREEKVESSYWWMPRIFPWQS